jgi:hypothetical protein
VNADGTGLRIAFDMDGVLADMHGALSLEAEQLDATSGDQTEMLWRRVAETQDFWAGLPETEPGIVARLAQTADRRRWEVIFLTQRPPTRGSTVQKQTQAWLRRHGYECPSVYTTRGSRGAIAAALNLDVVVDDRFEGCVDVADESNARAVLIWRLADDSVPQRARRLGIRVVRSAGECLTLLDDNEPPRGEGAGLFARLRQMLRRRNPRDAR